MGIGFVIFAAAAATCAPAAPRFAGGAVIVRPVEHVGAFRIEKLGPATPLPKDAKIEQTAGRREHGPPRCEAVIHIV